MSNAKKSTELSPSQSELLRIIADHHAVEGEPRPMELVDKRVLRALISRKLVLERKKGVVPSKAGLKLVA